MTTNFYTFGRTILAEEAVGGAGYRNYGSDALGSVVATYDSSGKAQNGYRFSPYGQTVLNQTIAPTPLFTWAGSLGYKQTTRHLPEFYVNARHYSSVLATWTTVDLFWPSQAGYGYAKASPAYVADPSGKFPCFPVPTSFNTSVSNLVSPAETASFNLYINIAYKTGPGAGAVPMHFTSWERYHFYNGNMAYINEDELPDKWYNMSAAPFYGVARAQGAFFDFQVGLGCGKKFAFSYLIDHPTGTADLVDRFDACTCQLHRLYDYRGSELYYWWFVFASGTGGSTVYFTPNDPKCLQYCLSQTSPLPNP